MTTLLVLGTSSDAGKSALVTALCRLLRRHGVRVAPFKAQNLALNSAVTADGGEIGRAQAVQARAAGVVPHADMNPLLLKPSGDGCQLVVNGRVMAHRGHDGGRSGWRSGQRPALMAAVLAAHRRLTERYPVVIGEGAGSPVEVNLRGRDLANLDFAEAVDCPVLLVADIERGGVFASLTGTLALMSASQRRRVIGLVVNRFHGDPALFRAGLDWLRRYTGKPVLGVIPYLPDLYLEGEDSLARCPEPGSVGSGRRPRVLVPRLPHWSNETDIDPLRLDPAVEVQVVGSGVPPPADLVILPGSKNVRADLDWLRRRGWPDYLHRHLRYRGHLLGVCGGFQMLGERVDDPLGLEAAPGGSDGLGLLAMDTLLQADKTLRRRDGRLSDLFGRTGGEVAGYEVHLGVSRGEALRRPLIHYPDGVDGAVSADGLVAGCYLHGLFDRPSAYARLLQWAGLDRTGPEQARSRSAGDHDRRVESGIDALADCVAESLDLRPVERALGLEPGALGARVSTAPLAGR